MNVTSSPAVHSALSPFIQQHKLAGAVTLVANKDEILSLNCEGFADIARAAPMKPSTLFWIASQTKSITATAYMMLVEQGLAALDDPVTKYLPEFKDQWLASEQTDERVVLVRPSNPILVRNLLNHTSGMTFCSAMEQPTLDSLSLAEAIRSYVMTPLSSEPGSRYAYSNAGVNTAGRIIEVVSGTAYVDFLEQYLFDPLGMADTTFFPGTKQIQRLAKPYRASADTGELEETSIDCMQHPLEGAGRYAFPAGGLFSTAADVSQFCRMFLNNGEHEGKRYLQPASVTEMTAGQRYEGTALPVGLGWFGDHDSYFHGGAMATNMTINPKHGKVLVYMVQHASFPGDGNRSFDLFQQAALAE